MEHITAIKGFKDILPGETEKWRHVENIARDIFTDFGIREIKVPILERTDLFVRGIGEATDIVEKEMYTFRDRGNEQISLRPEATASVIRAYIEHAMHASEPVSKLFTIGPMFRHERPQKGRFRQFHQINVEVLGQDDPAIDAELILLLFHFLSNVELTDLHLEINSLGCPSCRPAFREKITSFLMSKESQLCEDCIRRLRTNPLRIFDCKVEGCGQALEDAPKLLDFICSDCRSHFEKVQEYLSLFEIPYEINARMVRGLDYYTKTAFEVTTTALGAQNAVAGGGRYNGLVRELGGPDIPGIGFAIGMERLISLIPLKEEDLIALPDLFVAALGQTAKVWAFSLCNYCRMLGVRAEMDYGDKSLKSQMKRSNKLKSRLTLILGDKEIEEGFAELRDMGKGTQEKISLDNFDHITNVVIKKTTEG